MLNSERKPLQSRENVIQNNLPSNKVPLKNAQYKNSLSLCESNSTDKQLKTEIQLGMTSAISLEQPRPEHLLRTNELVVALKDYNVFETPNELEHRMFILAKLDALLKQWISSVSVAKHMPAEIAAKLGGKICTFGSYRLGVHHKGADIDALCVAPACIERNDFFGSFVQLLKKQNEVTELRAVEEAFVPVVKMKFDGIEIDLLFARLALAQIPQDFDMRDDNLLKTIDRYSVRSLNGCRVTDAILALVPNVDNFCLALRTIKLWAKKHGIYSNSLGYFGGVTWAILVARTCQLYPNAAAATLVNKFFMVFSRWTWPSPVLLKKPDQVDLKLPVWDPRTNVADRYHLMPIITPAYPQQNSTFNVSESTKKVIMDELKRGLATTSAIMSGDAPWKRLFEPASFFYRYKHFIALLVDARTSEDHLAWSGLVESKIRLLIAKLERTQHIALAHINPKSYDHNISDSFSKTDPTKSSNTSSPFCSMWFIGLEFERTEKLNIDLTESIRSFTEHVVHHGLNIKMLQPGMNIEARYVKRKQLTQYLGAEFLRNERKRHLTCVSIQQDGRKRRSSEMSLSTSSEGDAEYDGYTNKRNRKGEYENSTENDVVIID